MSKPSGFGAPRERSFVQNRCACGCGAYADRGFPGDRWYATAHVPPAMRFPWERGACSPWPRVEVTPTVAPAPDLFEAAPMDWGFRPT